MGGIKPHSWMREARKKFCNFALLSRNEKRKNFISPSRPSRPTTQGLLRVAESIKVRAKVGRKTVGFLGQTGPAGDAVGIRQY